MHTFLLDLHSLNRWLILIAGVYALVINSRGMIKRQTWQEADRRPGMIFVILLDVQLLLGLLLYVIFSPITTQGFTAALSNPANRFFIMEHSTMMILAVIVAHVGSVLVKKAPPSGKYKRAFIFYGLSFLFILAAIPWPFITSYGRPWFF